MALVTVAGWVVDYLVARIGYDLGFSLLDRGQKTVGAHVEKTRLNWFTPENTSVARQSIAQPDRTSSVWWCTWSPRWSRRSCCRW